MKIIEKKQIVENNLKENTILEKNILKRAKHPFLVQLKYSFQTPTALILVMEYIKGGEFARIISEKGLPEYVVRFVAAEVVLALEYLNKHLRVLYRDLKPENILLTSSGHIKLTDFGLAKRLKLGQKTNTVYIF
jgi:serum/glucocorticoid-regulated kinase 2